MIFCILYILICVLSSTISFNIWFMLGAILLDSIIDTKIVVVGCYIIRFCW